MDGDDDRDDSQQMGGSGGGGRRRMRSSEQGPPSIKRQRTRRYRGGGGRSTSPPPPPLGDYALLPPLLPPPLGPEAGGGDVSGFELIDYDQPPPEATPALPEEEEEEVQHQQQYQQGRPILPYIGGRLRARPRTFDVDAKSHTHRGNRDNNVSPFVNRFIGRVGKKYIVTAFPFCRNMDDLELSLCIVICSRNFEKRLKST